MLARSVIALCLLTTFLESVAHSVDQRAIDEAIDKGVKYLQSIQMPDGSFSKNDGNLLINLGPTGPRNVRGGPQPAETPQARAGENVPSNKSPPAKQGIDQRQSGKGVKSNPGSKAPGSRQRNAPRMQDPRAGSQHSDSSEESRLDAAGDAPIAGFDPLAAVQVVCPGSRLGCVALAGLAICASGLSESDPCVHKAAQFVRTHAVDCQDTYDLTVSILLLDRLARMSQGASQGRVGSQTKTLKSGRVLIDQQVDDSALIVEMGKRLVRGQGPGGYWTYSCAAAADGDFSNTQFAAVGAWVAGGHGVDVAATLGRCSRGFRSCQNNSGGWGYGPGAADGPSMTCAGLMALATGLGVEAEAAGPNQRPSVTAGKDRDVENGLARLEKYLRNDPGSPPGGLMISRIGSTDDMYFFWSLERVSVLFGLEKIGSVNWYPWGADRLVGTARPQTRQQPDGSWQSPYGPLCGTSFAILFLRRANVAPELARTLAVRFGDAEGKARLLASESEATPVLSAEESRGHTEERTTANVEKPAAELRESPAKKAERTPEVHPQAAEKGQQVVPEYLRELAAADADSQATLWKQLEARIARADEKTLDSYRRDAAQTLRLGGTDVRTKDAALELLGRIPGHASADPIIEQLRTLPKSLWPKAGNVLNRLTGEDNGPLPGDGDEEVLEVQKQWQGWQKREREYQTTKGGSGDFPGTSARGKH